LVVKSVSDRANDHIALLINYRLNKIIRSGLTQEGMTRGTNMMKLFIYYYK